VDLSSSCRGFFRCCTSDSGRKSAGREKPDYQNLGPNRIVAAESATTNQEKLNPLGDLPGNGRVVLDMVEDVQGQADKNNGSQAKGGGRELAAAQSNDKTPGFLSRSLTRLSGSLL